MILIENTKFACLECIRGHRSTLCRHTMRPLLQVRSKGRPNLVFPYGNRNYRVAVYAEKIEEESPSAQENGDCKNTPVVILKTTDKQVMDITSGQMLGPYTESQSDKQHAPLIGSESFVNTNACCSADASKLRKGCNCSKKTVLRLKILRSYISKKMALPEMRKLESPVLVSSGAFVLPPSASLVSLAFEPLSRSSETESDSLKSLSERSAPSCCGKSGTTCENSSSTESVVKPDYSGVKAVAPEAQPRSLALDTGSMRPLQNPQLLAQFQNKVPPPQGYLAPLSTMEPISTQPNVSMNNISANEQNIFQVISVPSCSIPGSCGCSSDCSCPACVVHSNTAVENEDAFASLNIDSQCGSGIIYKPEPQVTSAERYARELPRDFGQYSSCLAHFSGYDVHPPPFFSELQVELQSVLEGGVGQQNEFQPQQSPCTCANNDCFCTNCETHGIIDGYKLDDIFGTQANNYHSFPYG